MPVNSLNSNNQITLRNQFHVFYDYVACTASELFKCPNTDRCILASYVCDGDNHCGDWADEQNCCESDQKISVLCLHVNPTLRPLHLTDYTIKIESSYVVTRKISTF